MFDPHAWQIALMLAVCLLTYEGVAAFRRTPSKDQPDEDEIDQLFHG